jgi:hypothetical protein
MPEFFLCVHGRRNNDHPWAPKYKNASVQRRMTTFAGRGRHMAGHKPDPLHVSNCHEEFGTKLLFFFFLFLFLLEMSVQNC